MQMENGPRSGACDRCRRRSDARLSRDFSSRAASQMQERSNSAVASSKPEENQCFRSHSCLQAVRSSRSQRHSVMTRSEGTIVMSRNGRRLRSVIPIIASAMASEEVAPAKFTVTCPRLAISSVGLRLIRCQLIRARHMPASFTAIQVPPFGSRGKIARQPSTVTMRGGRAIERDRFSSRFIAR